MVLGEQLSSGTRLRSYCTPGRTGLIKEACYQAVQAKSSHLR
jgi:hypothetical protein